MNTAARVSFENCVYRTHKTSAQLFAVMFVLKVTTSYFVSKSQQPSIISLGWSIIQCIVHNFILVREIVSREIQIFNVLFICIFYLYIQIVFLYVLSYFLFISSLLIFFFRYFDPAPRSPHPDPAFSEDPIKTDKIVLNISSLIRRARPWGALTPS